MANDCLVSVAMDDLPFGGVGNSGMGNYHGIFGFETFTRKRTTLLRTQGILPELSTALRYQNESYDRSSLKYKILFWAMGAGLPSRTSVAIRNILIHKGFKYLYYILLVLAGYQFGKINSA